MAKKWTKERFIPYDMDAVEIAKELMANMREQDKQDMVSTSFKGLFDEICSNILCVEECYIYRGEARELLCIMGKGAPGIDCVGKLIYMLGTNAINNYKRELLVTEARAVIKSWALQHGLLYNAVQVDNEAYQRWLTRLGAIWLPEPMLIEGREFKQFIITEGSVANV